MDVGALSPANSHPRRAAVFMDRDGTLSEILKPDGSYMPINTPEDIHVYSQAAEGLAKLTKQTDLMKIMVTNQGGIAKGLITAEQLEKIDNKLLEEIHQAGGDIDAIYFASSNDDGNPMRKPNPGMLLEAAEDLNIDLSYSYMVGDMTTDVAAGKRASKGVVSILLETGAAGSDHKAGERPDVIAKDFDNAVDYIIRDYQQRKN